LVVVPCDMGDAVKGEAVHDVAHRPRQGRQGEKPRQEGRGHRRGRRRRRKGKWKRRPLATEGQRAKDPLRGHLAGGLDPHSGREGLGLPPVADDRLPGPACLASST
jgi:hypothetical protein